MIRFVCPSLLIVFATLGAVSGAAALPRSLTGAHVYAGLFGKVRLPRINVGKGVKAVVYPVTKTAVNGGKAAISGGEKAAKVYGEYRALSPNAKGVPSVPRFK